MTKKRLKNITEVRKLKPGSDSKPSIFWDETLTGYGVRVSPGRLVVDESGKQIRKPTYTFFFQGRFNGQTFKMTIGRLGQHGLTAKQANDKAEEITAKLRLNQDPREALTKRGKEAPATFGNLMNAYVELLKIQGKRSARDVENEVKKNMELAYPKLWKKAATEISLDDCMAIVGKVKDAGSLRQADKVRSYIRTAFSQAINARGDVNMPASMRRLNIKFNPARDMTKVKGSSQAKERALTLAEFRAYWKRINELPEPGKSLAVLHVLTGGQRQQQLARATLHDIDRDAPSLSLWDNKGRRETPRLHVIPLLPEALAAIDRITGGGEYVFSCNGGKTPAHVNYLNDLVSGVRSDMKEAKELEKGHFTPGSIRATVETRLAAKPYRLGSDVLGQLLSHGMGGVQARHYQHHDFFEEKLEALEMLQRMVEGQPEPGAQVIPFNKEASA